MSKSKRDEINDAFRGNVRKSSEPDGCWVWAGPMFKHGGYGVVRIRGAYVGAHRAAVIADGRRIAKGKIVCHKCDNPPCVNPSHLYVGDHKQNAKDCVERGRHANGWTRNPRAMKKRLAKRRRIEALRRAGLLPVCNK